MNLYETKWINTEFKNEEQTKVVLWSENYYYNKTVIGQFDFYYNEGYYFTLEGKKVEVKRLSTIMNYLFKCNENLSWDYVKFEIAKSNVKKIKSDEKKEYEMELKQKSLSKIEEFKNGVKKQEEKIIKVCELMVDKDDEYLKTAIKNTFKYADKKQLDEMFEFIRNYEMHIETKDVVVENLNIEKVDNKITSEKFETKNDKFYYNKKEFNTYTEAFNYVCNGLGKAHLIYTNNEILTYDTLLQLENEFINNKRRMNRDSAKIYYKHLETIPNSLDRENVYYKLKHWFNF